MGYYNKDWLTGEKHMAADYCVYLYNEIPEPTCHCHRHFELYIQTYGKRSYFLKNDIYELEPGDAVLIAPDVLHRAIDMEGEDYERVLITFDEQFLESVNSFFETDALTKWLDRVKIGGFRIFTNPERDEAFIKQCCAIGRKSHNKCGRSEAELKLMVIHLLMDLEEKNEKIETEKMPQNYFQISDILHYISENSKHIITLRETCEHFPQSYYHISRLFKEVTGLSFTAYVNILRVGRAKRLIDEGAKKVTVLGEQVGFGSQRQFIRAFIDVYETTPSNYKAERKRLLKEAEKRFREQLFRKELAACSEENDRILNDESKKEKDN